MKQHRAQSALSLPCAQSGDIQSPQQNIKKAEQKNLLCFFDPRMPDPVCMGSMSHENGTVYHINCASKTARENLVVKKSSDGFQRFDRIFVDTPAGYSDLAVKGDTLYVFYERDSNNGGLHFKKILL